MINGAFLYVMNIPTPIPKANIVSETIGHQAQHFEIVNNKLATLEGHGRGMVGTGFDTFEKQFATTKAPGKFFFAKKDTKNEIQGFKNAITIVYEVPMKLAFFNDFNGSQYDFQYSTQMALVICSRVLLTLSKISNLSKWPLTSRYFSYVGYSIYAPVAVIENVDATLNKETDKMTFTITGVEMEWDKERLPSQMNQTGGTLRVDTSSTSVASGVNP